MAEKIYTEPNVAVEATEDIDITEELETGVSSRTIARTIVTGIALLNTVLALAGKTPLDLDESTIYMICTGIAAVGSTVLAWWKNNSFRKKAIKGDLVKDGVIEVE